MNKTYIIARTRKDYEYYMGAYLHEDPRDPFYAHVHDDNWYEVLRKAPSGGKVIIYTTGGWGEVALSYAFTKGMDVKYAHEIAAGGKE